MSIHRSYLNKNNTIISNSKVNTARNPVTQLFYGRNVSSNCTHTADPVDVCEGHTGFTPTVINGYSRFLFDLDLADLQYKMLCCWTITGTTHKLVMTNTSNFDDKLINDYILVDGSRRATSFDLMLFKVTGETSWDGGVGYDYQPPKNMYGPEFDITYSIRPSNWFNSTTLTNWTVPGVYSNILPTSYQVLATQSFNTGDENISFSSALLDAEISSILSGTVRSTYGVAFIPAFELLTGLTEAYSVGFFAKDTQTFFEPYLESSFNDLIIDDRGDFNLYESNSLFLYAYDNNGNPLCLDVLPTVTLYDCNGSVVSQYTASTLTCGAYYINMTITTIPQAAPVQYEDIWSNIIINGILQPNVTNEFIIYDNAFNIGPTAVQPTIYGYSVSGIKEDEKITNGETRKVFVSTRVPYTTDQQALIDNLEYRMYVTQGTTQVEVIPWSPVNRTFTNNYFLLDTGWLIPNEYYLDIKATSNQQVDIYRKQIKFQIVNQL